MRNLHTSPTKCELVSECVKMCERLIEHSSKGQPLCSGTDLIKIGTIYQKDDVLAIAALLGMMSIWPHVAADVCHLVAKVSKCSKKTIRVKTC
jgi:hypothetical protein